MTIAEILVPAVAGGILPAWPRTALLGALILAPVMTNIVLTDMQAARAVPCGGAIALEARVSETGAFSNMRYTGEHAYGYTVMLWRAGDCLFGLFKSSQGLAGDTPIGELQNLEYDSNTGHLSFSAKLTMGVVMSKSPSAQAPSRDLFTFDGRLTATSVTGVITHALQNDTNATTTSTDVVLGMSKAEGEAMQGSTTYGEWRRRWQPILQSRGPKW
jgi:hypothetical protein